MHPEPPPPSPLTPEEFEILATQGVPFIGLLGCRVERFAPGDILVRLPWADHLVRPGGTVCGPAMMALADIVLYGLVLSRIGRVELAVTTDLNVHFLRKPRPPGDLLGRGRLLRLGRTLAVGEATILSDGEDDPVAHAVGSYAIPRTARP